MMRGLLNALYVYKKDAIEEERSGDDIIQSGKHPGEVY